MKDGWWVKDGWLVKDGLGDGRADDYRRTLEDYHDILDAEDLKHAPQIHEHEFNPFLLHDLKFQELHRYEAERGVVRMRMFDLLLHCGADRDNLTD